MIKFSTRTFTDAWGRLAPRWAIRSPGYCSPQCKLHFSLVNFNKKWLFGRPRARHWLALERPSRRVSQSKNEYFDPPRSLHTPSLLKYSDRTLKFLVHENSSDDVNCSAGKIFILGSFRMKVIWLRSASLPLESQMGPAASRPTCRKAISEGVSFLVKWTNLIG